MPGVASVDAARLRPRESVDTLEAAARNIGAQSLGFEVGQARIRDGAEVSRAAETALAALQAAVAARTGACLAIIGHPDLTGSDELNRSLSARRARAVADRLASLGVDPSFLQPSSGAPGSRSVTFRLPIDPERSAPGCGGGP